MLRILNYRVWFFVAAALAAYAAVGMIAPIIEQQVREYDCLAIRCTDPCAQTATRVHDYRDHQRCLECVAACKAAP